MIEMRPHFPGHGFSGVAPGPCSKKTGSSGPTFDCRVDAWQDPPAAFLSFRKLVLKRLLTKLLNSWRPAG